MAISNVLGPIMDYLDRFLIGAMVSVGAVAYYSTPYEIVTKLTVIPAALVGVLFPAFSSSFVQDPHRTALLFLRGVKYVFLSLFPILLSIMTFAYEGLDLWLGAEFARHGTRVLQWLAVGVFFHSLAIIAFALVQAVGRPDLTAKLHFIEMPCYLITVWWLIATRGIEGAAIAWVARVITDTFFLFAFAYRLLPIIPKVILRMAVVMAIVLFILGFASLTVSFATKSVFIFFILAAFTAILWFGFLNEEEKNFIKGRVKYPNF
jgi:O-antigen/teichoic acid export membrane protein